MFDENETEEDYENELMIARINHERAEREKLEQQRLELQKRKQKLIAENKKRRDDLANLDKDLEKFIDVSSSDKITINEVFVVVTFRSLLTPHRLQNPSRRCLRRLFEWHQKAEGRPGQARWCAGFPVGSFGLETPV